ncbi:ABC-type branched-subunit amino acid transport system ATPase component [Bradyrhizobium japonicum]
MAEPLLRVEKLVRRFGGIVATDNVSLDVAADASCTPSSARTAPARPR